VIGFGRIVLGFFFGELDFFEKGIFGELGGKWFERF
jgi:hypothetical protein